jgi:hypothetical protein
MGFLMGIRARKSPPETGGLQDWRLEIADCRLQIADCRLQIGSHGFVLSRE